MLVQFCRNVKEERFTRQIYQYVVIVVTEEFIVFPVNRTDDVDPFHVFMTWLPRE